MAIFIKKNGQLTSVGLSTPQVGYKIITAITNGTYSGASVTYPASSGVSVTAEVTITPSSTYYLPASVSVSGASYTYNDTTGVITLTNATSDVTITATCATQYTITTSVTNGTYTGDTTIISDRTASVTIVGDTGYAPPDTISVTGASYTYVNGVVTLSNPTANVTISATCVETDVRKGDILTLNLDGTDREYRVIKVISSDVVELMAMFNSTNSCAFASSGQVYEGNALDTHCNTTFYNTLTANAKSAIVDKTFRQDSWYYGTQGDPDYNGIYSRTSAYQLSLGNASFGNEITRHCYVLSVQDIIDYLEVTPSMTTSNTTLTSANVWTMFYKQDTQPSSPNYHWLRSADALNYTRAILLHGNYGYVFYNSASASLAVRPAFQINLSMLIA